MTHKSTEFERFDATMEKLMKVSHGELKAKLDVPVSISTIWRTLQDMKLTLKKSPSTRLSGTGLMS